MRHKKAVNMYKWLPLVRDNPGKGHPGRRYQGAKVPGYQITLEFIEPAKKHRKNHWRRKNMRAMKKFMRSTLNKRPEAAPLTRWVEFKTQNGAARMGPLWPNECKGHGPQLANMPSERDKSYGKGMDHETHAQMSGDHEHRLNKAGR